MEANISQAPNLTSEYLNPDGTPGETPHDLTKKQVIINLMKTAVPIFVQQQLRYLSTVSNYLFISLFHDTSMLGGMGLALCFNVLFFQAVLAGLDSAIFVIVPKLIGMHLTNESGFYFYSGIIVNAILVIPIMLIFLYSDEILQLVGQDSDNAYQASLFLKGELPGIFFMAWIFVLLYYLNSFQKTIPGLLSSVIALILVFFFNSMFYLVKGWGLLGGGYAESIALTVQFLILVFFIFKYDDVRETMVKPKSFQRQMRYMLEFIKVGLPSMSLTSFYVLSGLIIQPLAGLISPLHNGAQAILTNIYDAAFTIFFGWQFATSIYVGNHIGSNDIPNARLYAKMSTFSIIGKGLIMAVFLIIFSSQSMFFYTNDEEVIAIVQSCIYIFSFALVTDSINYSQGGILRGLGEVKIIMYTQTTLILTISIPLGCILAFPCGLGLQGLWLGYATRSLIQAVIGWYIIWKRLNWQELSDRLQQQQSDLQADLLAIDHELKLKNNPYYGTLDEDEYVSDERFPDRYPKDDEKQKKQEEGSQKKKKEQQNNPYY